MKDEIKEILEFKENADYKRLSVDEIVILKDYITNLQQEIKRLHKRNEEVYKEVRDYAYSLCITIDDKVIARRIIEHLATYLLFNTPIRKSDRDEIN